jgi:HD superfamily phosphodiesterase
MYVSTSKVTRLERKLGKEYLTRYEFLKQKFTEAGLNALNLHHPYFNDHGIGHIQRVISNLNAMINEKIFKTINPTEAYILLCCAWLHDIGMAFDHWKGGNSFMTK